MTASTLLPAIERFSPDRPVILPEGGDLWGRHWPELIEVVRSYRDAPQPMQDALVPLLQANGFRTREEQAASFRFALLRAAALDPYMSGEERSRYARRFGVHPVRRAWWWVRRQHETWDG